VTHDAPGHEADAKVDVVAPQRALADTPPPVDALRVTASEITSPLGSEMVSPAIESVPSETPVPSRPVHVEKEPRRPLGESTPIAFAESVLTPRELAPPRNLPDIPPVSLTLPPDSGLELVETREHVAPPVADEPAELPRPKRVRPPRVEIANEPLELIETHKDTNPPAP
jgi:hypothetical protein